MLKLAVRVSREALERLEARYAMPSEEFFEKIEQGESGDSDDVIEWSGEYELFQRTQRE